MTKEKFEPKEIFVDEIAITNEKKAFEGLINAVNSFAEHLEDEGLTLDDELLDMFIQGGHHPAITNRIMAKYEKKGIESYLRGQIYEGAVKTAARFYSHFKQIETRMLDSGKSQYHIAILNGKATPRGDVLEKIREDNTVRLKSPEDAELFEKLTAFVEHYGNLEKWLKENYPEAVSLHEEIISALTGYFYNKGAINSTGNYLINKPEGGDNIGLLLVNPFYFK